MSEYKVTLSADGQVHCRGCGQRVEAEYGAQDPAPCGCAWVWENGQLMACPSRNWGGARPGAGRPNLANEPTVEATISLPASLNAKARQLGAGNRSAGVRMALAEATMKFTAQQVKEAAVVALDNWDFDAIDTGDGAKQRQVLQAMVAQGGFEAEVGRGFRDIYDWLAEYASATAADM